MPNLQQLQRDLQERPLRRSVTIERAAVDEESRTVRVAFASGLPIDHYWARIALTISPDAMRTERLESGCAVLMDHNWSDQVGVVQDFSLQDGVARATIRFSRSARGEEIYQDVLDGIRQSISVGFMIHELHLESEKEGETPVYRSDDWEPYEISIVAVPADISVGVGRSANTVSMAPDTGAENQNTERNMPLDTTTPGANDTPAVDNTAARHRELVEWAGIFGPAEADVARSILLRNPDATREDIRTAIITRSDAQPPAPPVPAEDPAAAAARQGAPTELARSVPRYGTLRNFTGEDAARRAHRFGMWLLGGPLGRSSARQFCEQHGLMVRAMGNTVNEQGGYLVPEEFGNDLIDLREQYGVFRRNARIVPMASDTRSDPRRTGGLTAYFVGESDTITTSDKAWDRVSLVAKKLAVLARYSSEVSEDAAISLGDDLAGEIAYAFAQKEDDCGFNGDATSTYGGIVGIREKLKGLSNTIANIAGLYVGTGNAYSELVIADFQGVVGLLPQYADTPNAKWFVHRSFYYNVMVKAALGAGGVTAAEIEGARARRFLGYDVEFTQVMPKTEANSQVCAILGDLSLGARMGSRRETTIALSEHSRFSTDEIEIRGTERFDINVHDVGNAHATAANRVAGPLVGLITAAG